MNNQSNIEPSQQVYEETTLRDLILLAREYMLEVWRKKWFIPLFCIPFICWKAYEYYQSHPTYTAKVTFMIDEGEGGGGFNIGGILSSLGAGGENEGVQDKIIALSKSMRIINEVLLTKAVVEGMEDYIGNHLIRVEKINEENWSKKKTKPGLPSLKDFKFTHHNIEQFNRLEYSAVKSLMGLLNGSEDFEPIFSVGYDKKSGIMTFKAACRTEEMSIVLLNNFYDKLSSFYIEKRTEKNLATYNIVKEKVDSIRQALNSMEKRQAAFDDASRGLLLNVDKVPSQRYARDRFLLNQMYGESVKNLELANFALKSNTPYIQLIDNAVPPLTRNIKSRLRMLITALAMGILTGISVVVLRKIFLDSYHNRPLTGIA